MALREFVEEIFTGMFWTRQDEMIDEIENGSERELAVVYQDGEYIVITDYEEDETVIAYLGHAGSTIWIQKVEEE